VVPFASAKEASEAKLNLVVNKATPNVVGLFEDVIESLTATNICTNKK